MNMHIQKVVYNGDGSKTDFVNFGDKHIQHIFPDDFYIIEFFVLCKAECNMDFDEAFLFLDTHIKDSIVIGNICDINQVVDHMTQCANDFRMKCQALFNCYEILIQELCRIKKAIYTAELFGLFKQYYQLLECCRLKTQLPYLIQYDKKLLSEQKSNFFICTQEPPDSSNYCFLTNTDYTYIISTDSII